MKNTKIVFMGMLAVLLTFGLVFTGCPDPTAGENGKDGNNGKPGKSIAVLSGTPAPSDVQALLDLADIVIVPKAGITLTDAAGIIVVEPTKELRLLGNLTSGNSASNDLIFAVKDAASLTGNGEVNGAQSSDLIVGVPTIRFGGTGINAPLVSAVPDTGDWAAAGSATHLAVLTATDGDLVATKVASASQTLYVLDSLNLTGGTFPTIGGKIVVLGTLNNSGAAITASDLSVSAADNKLQLLGSVNSSKDITTGTALTLSGDFELTGTAALSAGAAITAKTVSVAGTTTITGTSTVTANPVTFTGAVSLGGALTVAGPATLGSTLTNTTGASATFNGATTVAGAVTAGSGNLTIAGTGAVEFSAANPDLATAANFLVDNTAGVYLKGASVIGTGGNTITLTKATLKAADSSGDGWTAASAGTLVGAYGSTVGVSLILADTGTIATAGTGLITVNGATGSKGHLLGNVSAAGAGTFTAAGTITFAGGATVASSITGTGTTRKLTLTGAAQIEALDAAEISVNNLEIDVSDGTGTAQIKLGDTSKVILQDTATGPGKLSFSGSVSIAGGAAGAGVVAGAITGSSTVYTDADIYGAATIFGGTHNGGTVAAAAKATISSGDITITAPNSGNAFTRSTVLYVDNT
ncbi:hypothetical protein FACS1894110_05570 [Spirochaetia bacterium]|nr:hypothetical protein FACS1894110_05570 [Spirochaetia bacterium]